MVANQKIKQRHEIMKKKKISGEMARRCAS